LFRAFLALRLSVETEDEIARVQQTLRGMLEGIRWLPSDKLHLTLRFFAAISEETISQILSELCRNLAGGEPLTVEATGLGVFPDFGNPRVIWVGLRGEGLLELYRTIEHGLESLGFHPEQRIFVPHITIARVRGRVDRQRLKEEIGKRREHPFGFSRIEKLIFYRSNLTSGGSVYRSLGEIPIGEEA
jgi:2'-5' RNA ligase